MLNVLGVLLDPSKQILRQGLRKVNLPRYTYVVAFLSVLCRKILLFTFYSLTISLSTRELEEFQQQFVKCYELGKCLPACNCKTLLQ